MHIGYLTRRLQLHKPEHELEMDLPRRSYLDVRTDCDACNGERARANDTVHDRVLMRDPRSSCLRRTHQSS